jgi:hypothetical protein
MDEQARKVGLNEAAFRAVNEQIDSLADSFGMEPEGPEFICECADIDCTERLTVSHEAYLRVREDPRLFLIFPGHEAAGAAEDVVAQADGYSVVQKREGAPANLARELR